MHNSCFRVRLEKVFKISNNVAFTNVLNNRDLKSKIMRENVFRNEEQRLREKALSLTHIGKEIMFNSVQRRLDSKTIILERKK